MHTEKRVNRKLAATAIAMALAVSSIVSADHVYITKPSNTAKIYTGCSTDIGYRVQYSDMAILKWVQLQLLRADQTVVIDKLDHATRDQWGESRTRSVSWQVPADLAPGEYTLKAFGNATYPCNDFKSGRRERCEFYLEDEGKLNILLLSADQQCPSVTTNPDSITATTLTPSPESATTPQENQNKKDDSSDDLLNVDIGILPKDESQKSGDSSSSYSQGNLDYINKNLASDKGNASETEDASSTQDLGTTGYSKPLQLVPNDNSNSSAVNITAETQQQNQLIQKAIQDSKDFDAKNETLTLTNGTTVSLSKIFPDKLTANRFLETLDLSNKTLANLTTSSTEQSNTINASKNNFTASSIEGSSTNNNWKNLTSTQLLDVLHHNSSLVALAPASTTHSISGSQLGHNLVQNEAGDHIQDKTSGTSRLYTSTSATAFSSVLIGYLASTTF